MGDMPVDFARLMQAYLMARNMADDPQMQDDDSHLLPHHRDPEPRSLWRSGGNVGEGGSLAPAES